MLTVDRFIEQVALYFEIPPRNLDNLIMLESSGDFIADTKTKIRLCQLMPDVTSSEELIPCNKHKGSYKYVYIGTQDLYEQLYDMKVRLNYRDLYR